MANRTDVRNLRYHVTAVRALGRPLGSIPLYPRRSQRRKFDGRPAVGEDNWVD